MGLETRRHVSASSQCLCRYTLVRPSGGRLACRLSNQRSKAARLKDWLGQARFGVPEIPQAADARLHVEQPPSMGARRVFFSFES